MKASEFQRLWEEAQMDIALLEAEVDRVGVTLAKVRGIQRQMYEGITNRPAPAYGRDRKTA
jgi:hypothetical protein